MDLFRGMMETIQLKPKQNCGDGQWRPITSLSSKKRKKLDDMLLQGLRDGFFTAVYMELGVNVF
jgi:hypothetical protein